jgi:alpha-beta hydrolase superfamily lysophospholipase
MMGARRAKQVLVIALVAGLVAGAGGYVALGGLLSAPAHRRVAPPRTAMPPEVVTFGSASGARLVAWLFAPPAPRAAAVLLHCLRCDRSVMVGRAELLQQAGYAVLVPDLQAHGESEGRAITFGYLEARDAEAAVAFVRRRFPGLPVAGLGVSLGGAAFVLAGRTAEVQALVLEAVYPTVEEAVDNRVAIRLGPLSKLLGPLLLLQLRPRLGIGPEALRPVDHIGALRCPVLVAAGAADRHTTEAQTRRLFAAAPEPKQLWLVPGAAHVDLLWHDPAGYRARVLGFLDTYVRPQRSGRSNRARQPPAVQARREARPRYGQR